LLPSLKSQLQKNQSWKKSLKTLNHDPLVSSYLLWSKMRRWQRITYLDFLPLLHFPTAP
jgi:hypothetical protein